jgi:hypothetical protein
VDADDPSLYVFVLDPSVRLVAHPDPALQGKSMKGVPDAAGKLVRDEMVARALPGDEDCSARCWTARSTRSSATRPSRCTTPG